VAANTNDLVSTEREIGIGFDHAARALALDATNAYALEQRGTLKVLEALMLAREPDEFDRLMSEARSDLETATRQDPSLATAHGMLSFVFASIGNNPQAIVRATQALQEDAYLRGADRIIDRLIYAQYDLGEFNESRFWCGEGHRRFPNNFRFTECALSLLAAPGGGTDVDSAWTLLNRLDELVPEALGPLKHGVGLVMVAGVLRNAGLPDSATSVLSRVDHSEQADPERLLYQYEAGILATTGSPPDADGAIRVLDRWAAASSDATVGTRSNLHWWWRDLQTRQDFQPFISPE
jgi:hypothetical protein